MPKGDESPKSGRTAPHVLFVADQDVFDRFGRMFLQLGLALSSLDVRVSLLTDAPRAAAEIDGTPTEDFVTPLRGWRAWRLGRYLRTQFPNPPSVVHLWSTHGYRVFREWTREQSRAQILHVNTAEQVVFARRHAPPPHEVRVAASHGLAKQLDGGAAIPVIPPGLLLPAHLESSGPGEHVIGLLWCGRFADSSGLDVLIDAVARVARSDAEEPPLHLGLIGGGDLQDSVWRRVRSSGAERCVSFIEAPGMWDRAMRGADVLVVPERQRELSLAPLLAMGMGKVVIASRNQIAEWFIDKQTAMLFTAGRDVELAQCIARVLDAQPDVRAMARSAAAYVREHHAISRVAEQMTALYDEILNRERADAAPPTEGAGT